MTIVLAFAIVTTGCKPTPDRSQGEGRKMEGSDSCRQTVAAKYATGFSVRDSADVTLLEIESRGFKVQGSKFKVQGSKFESSKVRKSESAYRFALVRDEGVAVPEGYCKVKVPVRSVICMTALQLSNFTALDCLDAVKGITGTKNLFNKDVLGRVKDGRIVKIGMEGQFDTELILAASPDIIFFSPSKRGGYDALRETGITMVPHLGYKELHPLGQAEWVKVVGLFLGKTQEANELFNGIEKRYNELKERVRKFKVQGSKFKVQSPRVLSGEMHYGMWHAVGGRNYLAQIFRDAGADYVIDDDVTEGENLEFEKMYALAAEADYWRILNSYPGEFSYEALKASEPRNALFKAFRERKVIYCNMKQQPYYELAPVQPDVLLKDFVAIFHPQLVEPDYKPTFYRVLKD